VSFKNDIVAVQPKRLIREALESALLCAFVGPAARLNPTVLRVDLPERTASMWELLLGLQENHGDAWMLVDVRQVVASRAGRESRE